MKACFVAGYSEYKRVVSDCGFSIVVSGGSYIEKIEAARVLGERHDSAIGLVDVNRGLYCGVHDTSASESDLGE